MYLRLLLRLLHLLVALLVTGGIIYLSVFGMGPLPPLGATLNTGRGVWTSATDANPARNATFHLSQLDQPVTVTFETNGTPHIRAATDHDLFWTMGYLHARFRLTQMDELRRMGQGGLSEILGPAALDSDRMMNILGIERNAQATWQSLPQNSPTRGVLLAYAQGVNARMDEEIQSGTLPMLFKLLNYRPAPWTPVDSFTLQYAIATSIDISNTPLLYAQMVHALGYERTMEWFPRFAPDVQHPYDAGPYVHPSAIPGPLTPLPSQLDLAASLAYQAPSFGRAAPPLSLQLPRIHGSNSWAVNGPKAAEGKAILAGDPHVGLSLPSPWFQVEAASPYISFSGSGVPGIPVILYGLTHHVSWTVTVEHNAATLFYIEQTDPAHPQRYLWNGAWRPMQHLSYDIPVKGAPPVHQDVYLTVHGPVAPLGNLALGFPLTLPGKTISISWIGEMLTDDIGAGLSMLQATDAVHFREALRRWKGPALNFTYADSQGNIGIIAPAIHPIVKAGAPWLPLPGTGEADVNGAIPYTEVPQVYDPPTHLVFNANNLPVESTYPYYIGTTWDTFVEGFRANEIAADLSSKSQLTTQDMEQIQRSVHDYLAGLVVPALLEALQHQPAPSGREQRALDLLQHWNQNMDAHSAAPSIWWTFLNRYFSDTFQPWWDTYHVPVDQYPQLALKPDSIAQPSLLQSLEVWTLRDQTNPAFTPPGGPKRSAAQVMRQAFAESVAELAKKLGNDPQQWTWGKLHTRLVYSSLQAQALSWGPIASPGDSWTINLALSDSLTPTDPTQTPSTIGPSWRMIVNWGSGQSESVYPGGPDENPASSWYMNQIPLWFSGRYHPMIDEATAKQQPGRVTWRLSN
jgi:penicillin amidase